MYLRSIQSCGSPVHLPPMARCRITASRPKGKHCPGENYAHSLHRAGWNLRHEADSAIKSKGRQSLQNSDTRETGRDWPVKPTNKTRTIHSLLTRGNVSCCDALMYVTCQPCAALASHVEKLWCCDGHPGVNGKDRALPDGRFQLAFSLAEGPISALADPMGDGGGIAPSLLIGIRSRFSIIDTAKLRSAMGVVFRPGGVHAFLKMPADAFHDKNVSLDLIWGSMVQTLRPVAQCPRPDQEISNS